VMRYMETFKAKEVPSPDHKKKHEVENDDVWELEDELKHKKRRIDKEVEARGTIMNPNEIGCTRRKTLALKDNVEDLEARRSEPE
jgi:hypothetical protein